MTSRERMLTALANGRPDRLPCQVHGWMTYYLNHYLDGMDWYQACEKFGMDYAIYVSPEYTYPQSAFANWRQTRRETATAEPNTFNWEETWVTPKGALHQAGSRNEFTTWNTEPLIKTEADFERWNRYVPIPEAAHFESIQAARDKLGDRGIVRCHPFSFGQGSPWQSFCTLVGTQEAIMLAMDKPDFVNQALDAILKKTLKVTELWKGIPADMIEIGGGAGSNTVISPAMFAEFCLPYDRQQCQALRAVGLKVVYHLCGGLMKMLDLVVQTGADGLETMTPPSMGGDCNLREASRRVGDKLFFIGGFDQNAGFEKGNPKLVRKMVFECFEATKDHAGYIIAPSDHFFFGDPVNLQAFADACKECRY